MPRNSKINGVTMRQPKQIPHNRLQTFAQSLDIGDTYNIPGYIGVARPLTSLVVMMVDLNLRFSHLRAQLNWFNDEEGTSSSNFQMMVLLRQMNLPCHLEL